MLTTDPPVVVEAYFHTTAHNLWNHLTQPGLMRKWYFEKMLDFKPESGFSTSFTVINEDRIYTHLWEVKEVVPPKMISYLWSYKEYPGDSLLRMEVEEKEHKVLLRITHTVLKDFPVNLPEFERESCVAGWQYFVGELKNLLDAPVAD